MPNPHCVCPASGFCTRHQINKTDEQYIACRGEAPSPSAGRNYWIAWEQGMLGATKPEKPITDPQPFRQAHGQLPKITPVPFPTYTREYQSALDSYKRPYEYPPVESADLSNSVRHLTFHLWPVANYGAWQWNCDRLMQNADLFNGQRIVAIATSGETDSVDKVKHYLRDFTDQFIVVKNDPRLREVVTWVPMLKMLEKYQAESDVTFSCHGKCVRHSITPDVQGSTIFEWTQAMYDTCLRWDIVQPLLEQFGTVGSFRRVQSHMTGRGGFGPWHYSGTFYWWRNRDAFRRNWMYTPNHFFGTEAWPGILFALKESGVLFMDNTDDLYDKSYFDSQIKPALEEWKNRNLNHA